MTDPSVLIFNVGLNYARDLVGAKRTDSETSAERFRQDYLEVWLASDVKVILDLDHTYGYSSTWLKEAFGGLILNGFTKELFKEKIQLTTTEDPTIITEINEYLEG